VTKTVAWLRRRGRAWDFDGGEGARERVRVRDQHPFPRCFGGSDYTVSTLKNTNNDNNNKRGGHALRGGASTSSTVRGGGGDSGVHQSLRALTYARTLQTKYKVGTTAAAAST